MKKRLAKTAAFSVALCLALTGVVNRWNPVAMFFVFMFTILVWEWYAEVQ